jgi:cathepsin A (carboxypeptidase C)
MRLSLFAVALGAVTSVSARQFSYDAPAGRSTGRRVNRRPDEAWQHVVKGADVASGRSLGEDSILTNFNLRANKVDPASLGVDTVKQISGYLDNEEEDKHLFYCQ